MPGAAAAGRVRDLCDRPRQQTLQTARVSDGAPAGLLPNDQNFHCEQCHMLSSSISFVSGVIRRSTRVSDGCDDAASAVIPLSVLMRSCAHSAPRVEAAAGAVLQALRVVQSLLCEHQEHRTRSPHARDEAQWLHVVSSARPKQSAANGVSTCARVRVSRIRADGLRAHDLFLP